MSKRVFWIACVLLLVLVVAGALPRWIHRRKLDGNAARVQLPNVFVQVAKAEDGLLDLTLPTSTVAHHQTPIWARANGYLLDYFVDIGDRVKEGQLMALIDLPDVDQQYAQAVATLASATSQRDIAEITADRWQALYDANPKTVSKESVDQYNADYLTAESNMQAALANKRYYEVLMDFKYVVAPFEGIVTERIIDIGSLITAGSTDSTKRLFTLASSDYIRLFVDVPQYFFRHIREGLEGMTAIREFGDTKFTGHVVRYAKALDPTSRTMQTELHIPNPQGEIYPGLYAEVHFSLPPDLPYYIVSQASLIVRESTPHLAIIGEGDVIHLVPVRIGRDFGATLEIIDGLHDGDRIVTNPTDRIVDGVKVRTSPVITQNR